LRVLDVRFGAGFVLGKRGFGDFAHEQRRIGAGFV